MLILGITGGMDRVHETGFARYNKDVHDSAAVLLSDGAVMAAAEEERFDRIKHSNKFPVGAIRFCLEQCGAKLADVDSVAVVNREDTATAYATWMHFTLRQKQEFLGPRDWVRRQLQNEFGTTVLNENITFVGHHLAHAMSAFACSKHERGLVVTFDGLGDVESGTVSLGDRSQGLRLLRKYMADQSLGVFYQRVGFYLGFKAFDEFKVMGLAPYGDASRYRRFFEAAYRILPDGDYKLDFTKLYPLLLELPPRKPHEAIKQPYMDVAASLQEMTEKVVFAVLHHYRRQTGEPCLSLAGGVAHNCALNGRLLASRMFDSIYVQPAAHDAGTALGAALQVHGEFTQDYSSPGNGSNVYWGRPLLCDAEEREIEPWADFLALTRFENAADLVDHVAGLLAADTVVGWIQGRSEFGPRALGNRSILADPRPLGNKDRINRMVKKREAFRPFAPAVLEEDLNEYFDVRPGVADLSFMTFAVQVRERWRGSLAAVTHVDDTARVQTVSRKTNGLFWQLINAFKNLTGIPILLNTSFNNNAEPIVDSIEDAVVCFLTTGLEKLVVGRTVISRKLVTPAAYLPLTIELQKWVELSRIDRPNAEGRMETIHILGHQHSMPATWAEFQFPVSPDLYRALLAADGRCSVLELLEAAGIPPDASRDMVLQEIEQLWHRRMIRLRPRGVAERARGGAA